MQIERRDTFLLGIVVALLTIAGSLAAQEWIDLFDGTTLEGWRAGENADSFSVEGGEIVVHGERAHLFYDGELQPFLNFHLRVEAMTAPGANSGIFFHTSFQESGWPSVGYEAQVNSTQADPQKTGGIYGVVQVNPAPSRDGEWFTMEVLVRDRRITILVDGKTTVDYLEPADVSGERRLSRGTIALQAHDPESVVRYRKIQVRLLDDHGDALTRAERVALDQSKDWWTRMDYGPFLSATVGLDRSTRAALKGITVPLSPSKRVSLTFDTELLAPAFAWQGWLRLSGVSYDGGHGGHPMTRGATIFQTAATPGWSHAGSLADPRGVPIGPLPSAWARYRGLYRHGDDVVFEYSVGETRVLETHDLAWPGRDWPDRDPLIERSLEISGEREELLAQLATVPGATFEIDAGGRMAIARAVDAPATELASGSIQIVTDRTDGEFATLAMGAPSSADAADRAMNPDARSTWVASFASPHASAGIEDGTLPRVHDGASPQSSDDTARTTWFDGERARLIVDLGRTEEVVGVRSYSWHVSNRAPQRYTLFGSAADGDAPSAATDDPDAEGWTQLAAVDTVDLGFGGKHGVSIARVDGTLGRMRYLLFDLPAVANRQGTFIGEIDVYTSGGAAPKPLAARAARDPRMLIVALAGADEGARLVADSENRLLMKLPATKGESDPLRVKVLFARHLAPPPVAALASWAPCGDLAALTRGGPSLWDQPIVVDGKQAADDAPYVIDDVPVPFENPWASYLRIGGLDLFADGDRAAVSTWNGDVWIVSGLSGKLKKVSWRRFATGLFETLGLKIVDGVIHTNGKDQITRLHDQDGDGEADFYECFNNDVLITRNFHEFTFDLQTDAEGNFYFSKAAPVRPGGRGFDEIMPHHGAVLKLSADGKNLSVYSTGLRAPNGIGVGPDGQVTAGDNEGTWVPHCKLHWLAPGSFQGVVDTAPFDERPTSYNPPLCWFPMEVDNSSGGQVWVTSEKWGPFTGHLLHLSYGQSSIYVVMHEEVEDRAQGFVFRLPVSPASGAMRARVSPVDGQLWIAGLKGWQTNAARLACLQRVRFTDRPVTMPKAVHARADGLLLEFTCELDAELAADVESYSMEQWNYVWGPMYGSPEVPAADRDEELEARALVSEQSSVRQRETVAINAAILQEDKKSVLLVIPTIQPVMQAHLRIDIESADGATMLFDLYGTIHALAAADLKGE